MANKFVKRSAVPLMVVACVVFYFWIGGKGDPKLAEAMVSRTTEQVAAAAGATVSPTAKPLKVEPK